MSILKIVAVNLLVTLTLIDGSVVAPALAPAIPAFRYTQIAPPSILPFSAQVSTFTRNLHVFDAPYAAGVIPGPPPIVQRALLPAPVAPLHPAPYFPSHVAPAPLAPFLPPPVAPILPYADHASVPYPGWPYEGGLVAPVARSVHAIAPPPPVGPFVGPAPLLG